jgi:hypothetical protein
MRHRKGVTMCMAVNCPNCGKPDWRGCGAHIEQVLGHVPAAQRCTCREQAGAPKQASPPPKPR